MIQESYSVGKVSVAGKVWYMVVRFEAGLRPVVVSPLFDTRMMAHSSLLRIRRDALVNVGKVKI